MEQRGTNSMVIEKAQMRGTCVYTGYLYGNGKEADDRAGLINDGQIVSMEADLDKGTLRFWVDGKQHGLGYMSGVQGRLRWAVSLAFENAAVEIVPTTELQPWSASWVRPELRSGED